MSWRPCTSPMISPRAVCPPPSQPPEKPDLRRDACICGDIVDELPLAQFTVSQHLKVLKDAGLIRGDIDGPRVCYCVEPHVFRRLKALVGSL